MDIEYQPTLDKLITAIKDNLFMSDPYANIQIKIWSPKSLFDGTLWNEHSDEELDAHLQKWLNSEPNDGPFLLKGEIVSYWTNESTFRPTVVNDNISASRYFETREEWIQDAIKAYKGAEKEAKVFEESDKENAENDPTSKTPPAKGRRIILSSPSINGDDPISKTPPAKKARRIMISSDSDGEWLSKSPNCLRKLKKAGRTIPASPPTPPVNRRLFRPMRNAKKRFQSLAGMEVTDGEDSDDFAGDTSEDESVVGMDESSSSDAVYDADSESDGDRPSCSYICFEAKGPK